MGHPREHTLRERLRSPYLWHRWLGLVLALLLIWVSVSGMLLNHEDDLGLSASPVRQTWLLDAWDVPEPVLGAAYRTRLGWVLSGEDGAFLGTAALPGGPLIGATDGPGWTLVVTRDLLHLYDPEGALIERFPPPLTPVIGLERRADGGVVLVTRDLRFAAEQDLAGFTALEASAEHPRISPAPMGDAEAAALRTELRARGLSWERIVRDLHAGHVPSRALRYLLDLVALGLIALAVTGVWIHLQRRGR